MEGVNNMKQDVRSCYKTRDLGKVKHYLDMRFVRKGKTIYISQDAYINSIMEKYAVAGIKATLMPPRLTLVPNNGQPNLARIARYQSIIESVGYTANLTRPDIAYTTHKLAQFAHNSSTQHMDLALHLLQYLNRRQNLAFKLGGDDCNQKLNLHGYSDYSYGDNYDRRSTGAYIFMAAGRVIDYKSIKQTVVATSTTYAEYMTLSSAAKEAMWLQKLLSQLSYGDKDTLEAAKPMLIYGDNTASLKLAGPDNRNSNKTKNFDITHHFVRERIATGNIKTEYVKTDDMIADGLTKALEPDKFATFVKQLGLVLLPNTDN